ncbi:MAG: OsmC family protein [Leptospirales bacterium]|nr:OsmC family protein [Leptospirales bacterium]
MQVELQRVGESLFEARAGSGGVARIDGPADLGGAGGGMRPMEMFLASLASCSAMDVIHILKKQRQTLADLRIKVHGVRRDATPATYKSIELVFQASGDVQLDRLQQAVQLSVEKYCSVLAMLKGEVHVAYRSELLSEA